MSGMTLQPAKPQQHPFKAVLKAAASVGSRLVLILHASQVFILSNREITKPGIQVTGWLHQKPHDNQGPRPPRHFC